VSTTAYIRRETLISVAINVALSLAFFLLVFGNANDVAVRGIGNYAFDFLPQSFMISLFSALVPGLITARKLKQGKVAPLELPSRLPRALLRRVVILTFSGAIAGGVVMSLLLTTGLETLDGTTALAAKMVFGGFLAAVVTVAGLRAALAKA
jgi:hypothetical protein